MLPDVKEEAQELLDKAVPDDESGGEPKLYIVANDWVFVAHATEATKGIYHGYPIPGAEVEERILRSLERMGVITRQEKRHLRKQKVIPKRYQQGQ